MRKPIKERAGPLIRVHAYLYCRFTVYHIISLSFSKIFIRSKSLRVCEMIYDSNRITMRHPPPFLYGGETELLFREMCQQLKFLVFWYFETFSGPKKPKLMIWIIQRPRAVRLFCAYQRSIQYRYYIYNIHQPMIHAIKHNITFLKKK